MRLYRLLESYRENVDPLLEINFNRRELIDRVLDAPISCGFEAETVWTSIDVTDPDDLSWNSPEVANQLTQHDMLRIEQEVTEWGLNQGRIDDIYDRMLEEHSRPEANETGTYWWKEFVSHHESDIQAYKESLVDLADDEDEEEALRERSDEEWEEAYIEEYEGEFTEWISDRLREDGEYWDDAVQEFLDSEPYDEWIDDEYRSMASFLDTFGISGSFDDEEALEEVGSKLAGWTRIGSVHKGIRTGDYHAHSGDTEQNYWRVESDSSIDADQHIGAEIISPVYDSPREMLEEMRSLFSFMEENGVETNRSTGLHVTMSMQGEQDRDGPNKLKMALLMGDQHVLSQFDRLGNSYTASQYAGVLEKALTLPPGSLSEFRKLENELSRALRFEKNSAINFKNVQNPDGNDLIEFRAAGGDYLDMMEQIQRTVVRYAAVMQAGHDDEAHHKAYVRAIARVLQKNAPTVYDVPESEDEFVEVMATLNPRAGRDSVLDMLGTIARSDDSSRVKMALAAVIAYWAKNVTEGQALRASGKQTYVILRKMKEFGVTGEDLMIRIARWPGEIDVEKVAHTLKRLLGNKVQLPEMAVVEIQPASAVVVPESLPENPQRVRSLPVAQRQALVRKLSYMAYLWVDTHLGHIRDQEQLEDILNNQDQSPSRFSDEDKDTIRGIYQGGLVVYSNPTSPQIRDMFMSAGIVIRTL